MGIEQTKGHTADGSGLRGHSVGDVYPYIVYAKGIPGNLRWHVMHSGGWHCQADWPTAKQAYEWAAICKHDDDELDALINDLPTPSHGDPLCYGV